MNASRRQAYEARTGRSSSRRHPGYVDPSGSAAVAAYERLSPQLARLRAAVTGDGAGDRSLADIRHDHAELDRLLVDAVTQAFAADAFGAPTPDGVSSWVAEGLARSRERELALFAAADVNGVLVATTVPYVPRSPG